MESYKGKIKIALSPIPYLYLIRGTLRQFEQRYTIKVEAIKCNSFTAFRMVEEGECKVGVIAALPEGFHHEKYDKIVIGKDILKLAVPNNHKLASKKNVTIKDITNSLRDENVKMILREEGSGTREFILSLFGENWDLVLSETVMTLDNNEEILDTVVRSTKYPVQFISLVSSVICETLKPSCALIDTEEMTVREFYAVRKKEDTEAEPLWSFLQDYLDIKLHLEQAVETLENETRRHLPLEYLLNKKFICGFCLGNSDVYYKIFLAPSHGIERVRECFIDDLRSYGRLEGRLHKLHLAILNQAIAKLRKIHRIDLISNPHLGEEIAHEIILREIWIERINKVVLVVIGAIIGSLVSWLLLTLL